jgi:hypothetical protein
LCFIGKVHDTTGSICQWSASPLPGVGMAWFRFGGRIHQ